MTVYVCLDDRNGMLFNNRRQSRDKAVLADLQAGLTGVLFADGFSEKLLTGADVPWSPAPERLTDLPMDSCFFLENRKPEEALEAASMLVIYRWNRHYPSDVRWEADMADWGFALTETTEFPGSSHETITKEVYRK